jgi:hypothetical protein
VWYFYSYQRNIVDKTISLSVNGGLFQVETYTDEMSVVSSEVGTSLGKNIVDSTDKTCLASFGNFSLFDRRLELKEIQSIYHMDKDKYVVYSNTIPYN